MKSPIKILYIHEYFGSGNGHSSELIRKEFNIKGIPVVLDAPDFPVTNPKETKEKIRDLIEKNRYDCIVASSLGAFYSMQIAGIKKILVNVALPENLRRIRDSEPEQNPGLSPEFIDALEKEKDYFFSGVFNEEYEDETYLIYGNKEIIAPNEEYLKQYFNDETRVFHVDMEHKLDEHGAKKVFELIGTSSDIGKRVIGRGDWVVSNSKGQSVDDECVAIDINTTGFSTVEDEIIELAAVKITDGKIADAFSVFVKPERMPSDEILQIIGIDEETLSQAETIKDVLPKFVDFCGDSFLIGHNIKFELAFLRENMRRMGLTYDWTALDTRVLSHILIKDLTNNKFDTIARYFNIPLGSCPLSRYDAKCTAEIFLALRAILREENIRTLDDLSDNSIVYFKSGKKNQ